MFVDEPRTFVCRRLCDSLNERINADIRVRYEESMDEVHVSIKSGPTNWGYIVRRFDIFVNDCNFDHLVDSIVRRYKEFILSYYFINKEDV